MFRRPATKTWTYLNGSRNVTLENAAGPGFYGTNDFRYDVVRDVKLQKGEVIFFEIVGYVHDNTPIMPPQDVSKLKSKEFERQYGKQMEWTYGCQPGQHKMFVYKIIQTNEDGYGVELSWTQMLRRCDELGLQVVPLLDAFYIGPGADTDEGTTENWRRIIEGNVNGPSTVSAKQIREGVVARIESIGGIRYVKEKSYEFKILEGIVKDNASYVDLEEVS